jgi:two-component system, LytTR family, response regulator
MTSERPLRVLIIDDEHLARRRLEDLLRREEGVEIIGMLDNGAAAVEAIDDLQPDLVFLDVQMPGMTGVEVVSQIGPEEMPATIFVTAYDHFAVKAFELAALDYLVKPFDDERFEQAFRRAREMIELHEVRNMTQRLVTLLGDQPRAGTSAPRREPLARRAGHLERLAVESHGQVRVVPVARIDYITASGPYAELHVGDKTFVIRERMQNLDERLDPERFFRIHRSAIVQLDRIETLLRGSGGDYAVRLTGGAKLSVSRKRREELEERLGLGRREQSHDPNFSTRPGPDR